MNEKFQINPFDPKPLSDVRLMAGRNTEMKIIRNKLKQSTFSENDLRSILITGDRGVGKTSFLNLIQNEANNYNLLPIKISLTVSNTLNDNEFFWNLFTQITTCLFDKGLLGGHGGEIDTIIHNLILNEKNEQSDFIFLTPIQRRHYLVNKEHNFEFNAIIKDLHKLLEEFRDSDDDNNKNAKFIFLLDEAEHIYEKKSIVQGIRYIIQEKNLGVGFIITGDKTYLNKSWENVFENSNRSFEIVDLDFFNEIEDVKDFFKKTLYSIGWNDLEIEETLFYKFDRTCKEIWLLTSGKPAWIVDIANKMFDRCCLGETKQLQFDKQAKNELKSVLSQNGDLNSKVLDYIENLSEKYSRWLKEILACELKPLSEIYSYLRLFFDDSSFISEHEFEVFCKELHRNNVIIIEVEENEKSEIGFLTYEKNFLDRRFLAFDINADSIKLWLLVNSDGAFSFRKENPAIRFGKHLGKEFTNDDTNPMIATYHGGSGSDYKLNLFELINESNKSNYLSFVELNYSETKWLYSSVKRLINSECKEILSVNLKNNTSQKIETWQIQSINQRNKLNSFRNANYMLNKYSERVSNRTCGMFEINITVDKIKEIDINKITEGIISTKDIKKVGIVIEDKMNKLVDFHLNKKSENEKLGILNFIYYLFENGFELDLSTLNNCAYISINYQKTEMADDFLNDAIVKINHSFDTKEIESAITLIYYNKIVLECKKSNYQNALYYSDILLKKLYGFDAKNLEASALIVYNRQEMIFKEIIDKNGQILIQEHLNILIEEIKNKLQFES